MRWVFKAAVQKGIATLPASERVNYVFQRRVSRRLRLDHRTLSNKLERVDEHLHAYRKVTGRESPRFALELGTGWFPVVPIGLFLAGVESVRTVDLVPHLRTEHVLAAVKAVLDSQRGGEIAEAAVKPDRLSELRQLGALGPTLPLDEILRRLRIVPLIGDAQSLPLPDGSVDLVCSNNTFEHIYSSVLGGILLDLARVLAPHNKGAMSHFIDLSDHFAHLDKSISAYNFLRFSARQWQMLDNSIQPQNRLRYDDYIRLHEDAGLRVVETEVRPGSVPELLRVPVHQEFANRDPDVLAITHCRIVSAR